MSNRNKEDIYDISTYTEKELYDLLDLNNPTDRELEAKIIFMIKKYNSMSNNSGDKLANFFSDIYNYFFDNDQDDDEDKEEDNINVEIVEGYTNINIDPTSQTQQNQIQTYNLIQQDNTDPNQQGKSAQLQKGEANIGFIKPLDYAPDQLNPLLKQTTKKIISIDSQYRDNKTSMPTDFGFNLSTPLKDVVSLKLYSVHIPFTWYTISKSYGSNFFYFKGNSPGILNNPGQDIKIDISAGNYSASELVTAVNDSINGNMSKNIIGKKDIYSDVSFGNTTMIYNNNTSLATFNIDITKQYSENSYYLYFEKFTTPNKIDYTGIINDLSRNDSITSFLGFNYQEYDFNKLNSYWYLNYYIPNNSINDLTDYIDSYLLDDTNNFFTVIKYIPNITNTNEYGYFDGTNINKEFNIKLSLKTGRIYSRNDIFNDLKNQILNCKYLSNESYIDRINITDVSNVNYNKSFFQLKLKPNRYTTYNLINSKICVKFPDDIVVWTGSSSCFCFSKSNNNYNSFNEINLIQGETYTVPQTINYTVVGTPQILLTCSADSFISPLNDIIINVQPTPLYTTYTITDYINEINTGILNATQITPFLQGPILGKPYSYTYEENTIPGYSYCYMDDTDKFNLYLKINKIFDASMYRIDFTDTYFNTNFGFGDANSNELVSMNDSLNFKGYISNGKFIIKTAVQNMPKVDTNYSDVKVLLTFDSSNVTYGNNPTYGNIYIEKGDNNYLDNNINNNWQIRSQNGFNESYECIVTEDTYTVSNTQFSTYIGDEYIDIPSSNIDVSSNGFFISGNKIPFVENYINVPSSFQNIYFHNYNFEVRATNLIVNSNDGWSVSGNAWTIDSNNNWTVTGNTFLTKSNYWDISNAEFTFLTNRSIADPIQNIDLSGSSLAITGNNYTVTGDQLNISYKTLWDISATQNILSSTGFTVNCNNLYISSTNQYPLVVNLNSVYLFNNSMQLFGENLNITGDNINFYGNIVSGLNANFCDGSCSNINIINNKYNIIGTSFNYINNIVNNPLTVNSGNVILSNNVISGDLLYISSNDNVIKVNNINYNLQGTVLSISNSLLFDIEGYNVSASSKYYTFNIGNIVYKDLSVYGYGLQLDGTGIDIAENDWDISGSKIYYYNTSYQIVGINDNDIKIKGNNFVLTSKGTLTDNNLPEISFNSINNTYSIITKKNITTGNIELTPYTLTTTGMGVDASMASIYSPDYKYITVNDINNTMYMDVSFISLNNNETSIQQRLIFNGNFFTYNLFANPYGSNINFNYNNNWYITGNNISITYNLTDTIKFNNNNDSLTTLVLTNVNNTFTVVFSNSIESETYTFTGTINFIKGTNLLIYSNNNNPFTITIGNYNLVSKIIVVDNSYNAPLNSSGSGIIFLTVNNNIYNFILNGCTITTPQNSYFIIKNNTTTNIGYDISAANIELSGNNLSIQKNIYRIDGTLQNNGQINLSSSSDITITSSSNIQNSYIYLRGSRTSLLNNVSVNGNIISIKKDISSYLFNGSNSSDITISGNLNNLNNNTLNIFGNLNINNNNSIFEASFNSLIYPSKDISLNSQNFHINNTDSTGNLYLTGDIFTATSMSNYEIIGNSLTVNENSDNWSMIGSNLIVYDQSFQLLNNSFTMPGSDFLITNGLGIQGNNFQISGNNFSTPSTYINIKTTADFFNNSLQTRTYSIYGSIYEPPNDTISFASTTSGANYNWTPSSYNGFSLNNTLQLNNNNNMYLKGSNFTITSNGPNNFSINSPQLTVSADLINVLNGGNITFVGRKYLPRPIINKPINIGSLNNLYDFSVNVIYTLDYSPTTNLLSYPRFSGYYPIYPDDILFKIYPRFNNETKTFGNESDQGYIITNNTNQIYNPTSLNDLQNIINTLMNNFIDNTGQNILFGSSISFTLNTSNSSGTLLNCDLNLVVKKTLHNKDYAITFKNSINGNGETIETWKTNFFIDASMVDVSYGLINYQNNKNVNTISFLNQTYIYGNEQVEIIGIKLNTYNNKLTFVAYEDGAIYNNVTITIPIYSSNGSEIVYSRDILIKTINNLLSNTIAAGTIFYTTIVNRSTYVVLRPNINLIYKSNNYNLVFYDTVSFVQCYVGAKSVKNTTWDTTVGWILGFRNSSEYDLSQYITNVITITGDTGVCTNLFNYFLLCIDDYTQNHLNDGLVTITSAEKSIALPSYADRTNFTCDPVTRSLTYNNNTVDYSKLTQNQIYSLTQIANNKSSNSSNLTRGVKNTSFGTGPYVQDIFGLVPIKTSGLQPGSTYIEFGGTLQNQERVYFGPVNIHRMSVKLVTDRGDIVDLNDVNWSFSLLCEQLYKPRPSKNS
jgi:hypothetical protein